jgi:hypothetical protein
VDRDPDQQAAGIGHDMALRPLTFLTAS